MTKQRIFTQHMGAQFLTTAPAIFAGQAIATWVMQEDIRVLGATLSLTGIGCPPNDGMTHAVGIICPNEADPAHGGIGRVYAYQGYKGVVGAQELTIVNQGHCDVMFPAEYEYIVKEEGTLNLFANIALDNGDPPAAGIWTYYFEATIYYLRLGQKR